MVTLIKKQSSETPENIRNRGKKQHFQVLNFSFLTEGNNPMVGATVACAVAVEECMK